MKNIAGKLVKVMGELKRVAKNGRNEFHKYDYVTEADIMDAVREQLVKNNVAFTTSVEFTNKEGDITSVMTRHMFIDADSGEIIEVKGFSHGQDKGDKAAAKAITSATKYALMKTFMISTGDDIEATDAEGKSTGNKVSAVKAVPSTVDSSVKKTYGFSARPKAATAIAKAPETEMNTDDNF